MRPDTTDRVETGDESDARDPLAPFAGSFEVPELGITRRWFAARDLTPETSADVLDLLREAFNDQVSWFALPVPPADHLDWKFRDRPTGSTVGLTLDSDGHVVGFIGAVRRIWYLQGRPYVVRAGYDLSRSRAWQGRGLSRAFQPFRGSEWHPAEHFAFGYVTHPADRHMSTQRGEQAPANETRDYVRLLHPLRIASAALRRRRQASKQIAATTSNTARVIRSREESRTQRLRRVARRSGSFLASVAARRPAARSAGTTISTVSEFDDRHEPFVTTAVQSFDFVADRSIDYLNWRFCDERAGPFIVRVAQQDGEFLGYAVTRVLSDNAYLADILAHPEHLEIAELLVRDAIQLAQDGGASSIRTRLPKRHPYGDALRRAGFFDIGHVAGELIGPRNTPPEELAFLDDESTSVHHVLADSDFL